MKVGILIKNFPLLNKILIKKIIPNISAEF